MLIFFFIIMFLKSNKSVRKKLNSLKGYEAETILRKERNVLFNDTLNTFYLRLYGVGHMVKDHSDSERKPAVATWDTLSD